MDYATAFADVFQSTQPMRAATTRDGERRDHYLLFQSTQPMRAATLACCNKLVSSAISIHAARVGSDSTCFLVGAFLIQDFNPRCPCGQRPGPRAVFAKNYYFNPRCPCGQRPVFDNGRASVVLDFNPRCPCGQRLAQLVISMYTKYFNPRCPCGQRLGLPPLFTL